MLSRFSIALLIFIIFLDATVGVFLYSIGLNQYASLFIIPTAFVLFLLGSCQVTNIKLKCVDVVILSIIAVSALRGAFHLLAGNQLIKPEYILFDVIGPFSFVTISCSTKISQILSTKILKLTVKFLTISACIGALIFLVLGASVYQGITLPVNLPISFFLACLVVKIASESSIDFKSILLILISFSCAFVSGKRSYLLSAILLCLYVSTPFLINQLKFALNYSFVKLKKVLFLILIIALISISMAPALLSNQESKLSSSLVNASVLIESRGVTIDDSMLSILSAGRSDEVVSLLPLFASNPLNILIGFGPGFTYKYNNKLSNISENSYRNIHFSPLNLTSKYGLPFSILFYYQYLIKPISKAFFYLLGLPKLLTVRSSPAILSEFLAIKTTSTLYLVASFFIFLALFQSLFAFTLFVDPLLPIIISLYRRSETQVLP